MEPQHPDAGTPAGSEESPPPLVALLAPAAAIDTLTGSPLSVASAPDSEAAGVPSAADVAAVQEGAEVLASSPGPLLPPATAAPVPFSPWLGPLSPETAPTLLMIAGRRYAVADLPPDAQDLFEGIRLADLLLAQKGETCQLLRWGLDALVRELGQQLKAVEPLPELQAVPDPQPPWGDGAA
ncbi:MAG: DUF6447 family protein [Synechococcaceae cyanobacterium]|nr:DUF6447 family protein [Synechococcaceae cyanobacterium]